MARSVALIVLLLVSVAAIMIININVADAQPAAARSGKKVKCYDKKGYPLCGSYQFSCPPTCPYSCYVDCDLCRPVCSCDKPGGVCQDPRFVGGDGITFYFHGKKDGDFCLLSDSDLHINAHFIGKRGNPTMTRDFTWVQSIAILFDNHQIYIGARKTAQWEDATDRLAISYDGETVELPTNEGAMWQSSDALPPAVSIVRSSSANAVTLEVEGKLKITANVVPITEEESRIHNYGITSEDCYAHLELGFKFYAITNNVHGVLGQTYREGYVSRVKVSSKMPLMGGDKDFSTSGLFAPDCAVSRFGHNGAGIEMVSVPASLNCASGFKGRGIVCKK